MSMCATLDPQADIILTGSRSVKATLMVSKRNSFAWPTINLRLVQDPIAN